MERTGMEPTEMERTEYRERRIDGTGDPLRVVAAVVRAGVLGEHVVYERAGRWHVAGDPAARVVVDDTTVCGGPAGAETVRTWQGSPWSAVAELLDGLPIAGWRAFGWVDFEMAAPPGGDRSAVLMVPRVELVVDSDGVLVRTLGDEPAGLDDAVRSAAAAAPDPEPESWGMVVPRDDDAFRARVVTAVERIRGGDLRKVILSRAVDVPFPVDLVATWVRGRRANTPARSFLLDLGEIQAAGFSPETVVEVDASGAVSTQPLAGTRRRTGDPDRDGMLREELYDDPKEVFEHALSVKLAVEELERVGADGTTSVTEFLTVRQRGSVQHLASRVATRLTGSRTAWDAFEAVFPSITASGVPKRPAFDLIAELEPERRGLYSGAVLMAGADGTLDAALVLRTVFRHGGRTWLRAGAGIVGRSVPERELEETSEKLASVAPHLVPARRAGAPGPQDATLARLRGMVAELLGTPAAELPDSADLTIMGVDSMSLMRLAIGLRRGGLDVSYPDLAADPTLRAWTSLLTARQAGTQASTATARAEGAP